MKKNNILKVVLLAILVAVVCTWIFPAVQYTQTSIEAGERVQVGIFNISEYMLILFRYFMNILLVVLSIGAFYGVAYRIPAYRLLLDRIVEKFKGKENVFLIAVMSIVAIVTSLTGLNLGVAILFVFPFIISLVLLMGYNKLVAASVTVGSFSVGLIGTTLATTTSDYINLVLNTKYSNEMISKIILLVLGLGLLIFNVLKYASKTRNETDKVLDYVPAANEYESKEVIKAEKKDNKVAKFFTNLFTKVFSKKEKKSVKKVEKKPAKKVETKKEEKKITKSTTKTTTKKPVAKKKAPAKKSTKTRANDNTSTNVLVVKGGKKVKVWPFIVVFDLLFLIILVSLFDWKTIFGVTWFEDALNAIKDFKIGGFPIFAKLLGAESLGAWGAWNLANEIPLVILVFTGILALMYNVKFDKFIEGILDGMKRAFVPAITMFIAYLVLVICVQNLFQLNLTKFFLELTSGLNVITMTLSLMFSSIFNMDAVYIAQTTLPYVTTVITDTSLYPIIAVMVQAVYGLMMLIAPTSIILIGVLSFLDIPYLQWIKHIWKLFLELLLVLLIFFLILVLI